MTEHELRKLLSGIPVPLLLVRGNAVFAYNDTAAELFPGLSPGDPLPGELAECRPGRAAAIDIRGEVFLVTAKETGQGTMLTLSNRPELPVSPTALAAQLRQRLSVSMSAAQVLAPAVEEVRGNMAQEYFSALNKGLYQILRIARNLERTDREGDAYRPAAVDLAALCAGLCEQAESLCAAAGLSLLYEPEVVSLMTTGDGDKLIHMLAALMSNAAKAAGHGGNIVLRLSERRGRAILTVRDDGPGLTEADLAAFWAGGSAARVTGGLSLGLPLVRHIARLHGGAVMVETGRGDGMTVTVSLPVVPPEAGLLRDRPSFQESFSDIIIELSDALPAATFRPKDLD